MDFYGHRIGDTPLYQMMELGDRLTSNRGRPAVWIKDESQNTASRTFKDRLAAAELLKYESNPGLVTFAGITYGNCGEAFGVLCKASGKRRLFASIVDKGLDKRTKRRFARYGPVIETDLSKRYLSNADILALVNERVESPGTVVLVGGIDTDKYGYSDMSDELYPRIKGKRAAVVVPVGEGNLMANMIRRFEELDYMPYFIGVTIPQNPFSTKKEKGIHVADKLGNEFSDFEIYLRELCQKHKFPILTVQRKEVTDTLKLLRDLGVRTGPTAATAFAGAIKYSQETGFDHEDVIIINTGYEPDVEKPVWKTYAKIAASLLLAGSLGAGGTYYYKSHQDLERRRDLQKYMDAFYDKAAKEALGKPWVDDIRAKLHFAVVKSYEKVPEIRSEKDLIERMRIFQETFNSLAEYHDFGMPGKWDDKFYEWEKHTNPKQHQK